MQETAEIRLIDDSVLDRGSRDRAANLVVVPDESRLRDVATLGRVDAVHMAHALAVFRILTIRDIDAVLVNHRGADQLVAGFGPD